MLGPHLLSAGVLQAALEQNLRAPHTPGTYATKCSGGPCLPRPTFIFNSFVFTEVEHERLLTLEWPSSHPSAGQRRVRVCMLVSGAIMLPESSSASVSDGPLGGCLCSGGRAGGWDIPGEEDSLLFLLQPCISLSSGTCQVWSMCVESLVPSLQKTNPWPLLRQGMASWPDKPWDILELCADFYLAPLPQLLQATSPSSQNLWVSEGRISPFSLLCGHVSHKSSILYISVTISSAFLKTLEVCTLLDPTYKTQSSSFSLHCSS